MFRIQYAVKTPNCEALQPRDNYQSAVQSMCMGDLLYQRGVTEISYDRGGYERPGDWVPVVVPGISHCAVCTTQIDLAPGWGFNRYRLYCVDHWCEITEHVEIETLWQQRHKNDQQAA